MKPAIPSGEGMAGLLFLNKHYPLTLPPLLGEGAYKKKKSDPAALVQSHRAEQVLRQGSIGGNPAPGGPVNIAETEKNRKETENERKHPAAP